MTDESGTALELQNNVFVVFDAEMKKTNNHGNNHDLTNNLKNVRITEPFSVLDKNNIAYGTFYEKFLIENRPCLFTSSITDHWKSRHDWVNDTTSSSSSSATSSPNGSKINFDSIERIYGGCKVSVVECDKYTPEYSQEFSYKLQSQTEDSKPENEMTMTEYLTYWKSYIEKGYPDSMKCLYLKDWHILKDSKHYTPYVTPTYFRSDWLNEVWGIFDDDDDFIFCYMGPKGTWTPFHCDVYGSFSWSANVVGTKKWHIYPPGGENRFRNVKTKKLKYDYNKPGVKDVDYYEVIQNAGEVIFVPSGWFHVVWNLDDTISINHNWMNGANVFYIWNKLKEGLQDVKCEISHLKHEDDFAEVCQTILKANHGMDYPIFLSLLQTIEENRKTKNCSSLGTVHRNFDLYILNLLQMNLCNDVDVNQL